MDVPDFDRWGEYLKDEWDQLSPQEKALCLSYVRNLGLKKEVNNRIISEVNKIHEKHVDFHLGFMPITKDLSGYLPEVN